MSFITDLSVQQLRKAAALKEKIEALEKELHQLLGANAAAVASTAPAKKFKMSAAAKAKISRAAKARWAKVKGDAPAVKPGRKSRRKMSAATKAKLSAKLKAAWAARKAAKK